MQKTKDRTPTKQPSLYITGDSEISSLLLSQQQELSSEKRGNDACFIFQNYDQCNEIVDAYFNGQFPQISGFVEAQRKIKKIIINLTK